MIRVLVEVRLDPETTAIRMNGLKKASGRYDFMAKAALGVSKDFHGNSAKNKYLHAKMRLYYSKGNHADALQLLLKARKNNEFKDWQSQQLIKHQRNVSRDARTFKRRNRALLATLEAVDPEDRKIRLKNLLSKELKWRKAARAAHEFRQAWDSKHGGTTRTSSHQGFEPDGSSNPGAKAQDKQYDYYHKAVRARAILQKHTGQDYHLGSYDWYGGNTKIPLSKRPSIKRRADAYAMLRDYRTKKNLGVSHLPTSTKNKNRRVASRWLAKRVHAEKKR